jgi:glycosyltransferase involved in cell wall biosynthesis
VIGWNAEARPKRIGVFVCSRGFDEHIVPLIEALQHQLPSNGYRVEGISLVWNHDESFQGLPSNHFVNVPGGEDLPPVREYYEPAKGIPYARNRALDVAEEQGVEYICFIDDDCIPHNDWLAKLTETLSATGADVVAGGWQFVADGTPSTWLPPSQLGQHHYRFDGADALEGDAVQTAFTRNVIFRLSMLASLPEENRRFPEFLAGSGGSDSFFFSRVYRAGLSIIYSPRALVDEIYSGERLTLRWHVKRRIRNAQVRLKRRRETGEVLAESSTLRRSIVRTLTGLFFAIPLLIAALVAPPLRPRMGRFLLDLGPYLGLFLLAIGVEFHEYNRRVVFNVFRRSRNKPE